MGRRDGLLAAGLIDSFGLAVGWTVLSLQAVALDGFAGFGLLSAGMLAGVAVSAPITGWLTRRLDGHDLLWTTGAGESVLRALAFGGLLLGWPIPVVAVVVFLSSILAWIGFAGMRAEVNAASEGAASLSAYTALIAAAESGGAFVAAGLPVTELGTLSPGLLVAVMALYSLSLLPTLVMATSARTGVQPRTDDGGARGLRGLFLTGGAVALLGSGPMLLAVGVAVGLHGRGAVGPALLAFTVGSLAGPLLAKCLARTEMPPQVAWVGLGMLMLAGWPLAASSVVGLLVAQLLSGLAFAAFEGLMDAQIVDRTRTGITAALAWAASARAIGSAVAVTLIPQFLGEQMVPAGSGFGLAVLALLGVVVLLLRVRSVTAAEPSPLDHGASVAPARSEEAPAVLTADLPSAPCARRTWRSTAAQAGRGPQPLQGERAKDAVAVLIAPQELTAAEVRAALPSWLVVHVRSAALAAALAEGMEAPSQVLIHGAPFTDVALAELLVSPRGSWAGTPLLPVWSLAEGVRDEDIAIPMQLLARRGARGAGCRRDHGSGAWASWGPLSASVTTRLNRPPIG